MLLSLPIIPESLPIMLCGGSLFIGGTSPLNISAGPPRIMSTGGRIIASLSREFSMSLLSLAIMLSLDIISLPLLQA